MRKSKDIKGKKVKAGLEYKKGNRKEAYKLWGEAKKEMDELRRPPEKAKQQEGAS